MGFWLGSRPDFFAFVPFVGWALGLITALTLAMAQFWPGMTGPLLVIGVFAVGQALDAGFLSPNIVGSKIGLHPVWLIFALFASYLFGFVGTLVAVPVAARPGRADTLRAHGLSRKPRVPGRVGTSAPSPVPQITADTAP